MACPPVWRDVNVLTGSPFVCLLTDFGRGYYAAEYLPTSRGFDSHLGYYEGYMDYYAHSE